MRALGYAQLRWTALTPRARSPNVAVVGYSIPHPSETCVMVRVQTTGAVPAVDALRSAAESLSDVCDHVKATFEAALAAHAQAAASGPDVEMAASDGE